MQVYKGVVQEYPAMVDELTSGPCIVMEIRAQNAPQAFREMTGPADPVRGGGVCAQKGGNWATRIRVV